MIATKKHELIIITATMVLVLYTLTLSMLTQVMSSVQTSQTISNAGTVKAIGVGIYWDQNCTSAVSAINWGTLDPSSTKNVTVHIRNEGDSNVYLDMSTSNWNPSNASNYITLSWNYDGQPINVDQVIQITFTLSVSENIEGITSFSFDITIIGSE